MRRIDSISTEALRTATLDLLEQQLPPDAFSERLFRAAAEEGLRFAALVWLLHEGQPRIVHEYGLRDAFGDERIHIDKAHILLVDQCCKSAEVQPGELTELGNQPTLLFPILVRGRAAGALELLPLRDAAAVRSAAAGGDWMLIGSILTAALSRFLKEQRRPQETGEFWHQYDRFLATLHAAGDVKSVANVVATDGCTLLQCDRLAVVIYHGRRPRIAAIGHAHSLQRRGKLLRALVRLAREARLAPQDVVLDGRDLSNPDECSVALADYVAESRSKAVRLVPVRPTNVGRQFADAIDGRRTARRPPMGMLVLEQFTATSFSAQLPARLELLSDHVATALANANRYESIPLLGIWQFLGRLRLWLRGRRLATTLAVVTAAAAVLATLYVVPYEYRVVADGRAMPVDQHEIFAPFDGTVHSVPVQSGQRVEAGTILVVLENDDFSDELVTLENSLRERQELARSLGVQGDVLDRQGRLPEALELQSQLKATELEAVGIASRLAQLRKKLDRLTIRATHPGVVATFQVQQLLRGRPVTRGDLLMEVMEDRGEWRLELDVPEYRIGHVLQALDDRDSLSASFVPMTAVDLNLPAKVVGVANRSNRPDQDGMIVEVFARIDPDHLPQRRIGTEVMCRIDCGKKSLLYCLLGDLYDFVRRRIWW